MTRKITSPRRLGTTGDSNGGQGGGSRDDPASPDVDRGGGSTSPCSTCCASSGLAPARRQWGEYGTVSIPEKRAFLALISPYNQLKLDVNYPEPLIFTATKDDQVGPVHARKFAAIHYTYLIRKLMD